MITYNAEGPFLGKPPFFDVDGVKVAISMAITDILCYTIYPRINNPDIKPETIKVLKEIEENIKYQQQKVQNGDFRI